MPFSCFQEGLPLWEEVAESLLVWEEEGESALLLLPSQRDSVPAAQRVWSSLWDPAASYKTSQTRKWFSNATVDFSILPPRYNSS